MNNTTANTTWGDLESPIADSHSAAAALDTLVDSLLASRHPTDTPAGGYVPLLVDEDAIDALRYTLTRLREHTRDARDGYYSAHAATKA